MGNSFEMEAPEAIPTAFPTVSWGQTRATFAAGRNLPLNLPPVFAALVFARDGENYALANIAGRGWCIPGGRLEPGETPEQAARRETIEEIGATLGPLTLLGWYTLTETETAAQSTICAYCAEVMNYAERPEGFESLGRGKFSYAEIPALYFSWDALLAAVFALAEESRRKTEDGRQKTENSRK
jgi:8-oxo-dGTP diphosphatase